MATLNNLPTIARKGPEPLLPNGEVLETVDTPDALLSANDSLFSPSVLPHGRDGANQQDGHLYSWWQEAMCHGMEIPSGYLNVAVLLIRWKDEIDELKCAPQVDKLQTILEQKFDFTTELLTLDNESKAQYQLTSAISTFLGKYDKPHNLVIVYYNGHGIFDEKREHLEITASNESKGSEANNLARASWNTVELSLIQDVDCDVLSILDCCFASDMQRNTKISHSKEVLNAYFERHLRRDLRPDLPIYELLTAAGPGLPTSATPKHSFTGRLIQALEYFAELGTPFSTHDLNQQIIAGSAQETISCLFNRFRSHTHWNIPHITLDRVDTSPKRQDSFNTSPTKSYLTLKFALKTDSLDKDQIKDLAKRLTKACKEKSPTAGSPTVEVRQIDWISLRSSGRPDIRHAVAAFRSAKRWRRDTRSHKQSLSSIATPSPSPSPSPSPNPDLQRPLMTPLSKLKIPPSATRKRPERVHEVTITPSPKFVLFGFAFEILGAFAFLVAIAAFFAIWIRS